MVCFFPCFLSSSVAAPRDKNPIVSAPYRLFRGESGVLSKLDIFEDVGRVDASTSSSVTSYEPGRS